MDVAACSVDDALKALVLLYNSNDIDINSGADL
jgi:hypothetical protein